MACNVAFSPPTGANVDAVMLEKTRQQIHAKADKAWKDNHELVYNHQQHYNGQLVAFIEDAEELSRKNGVRSGNASTSSQTWKVSCMTLALAWPSKFSTSYPSFP